MDGWNEIDIDASTKQMNDTYTQDADMYRQATRRHDTTTVAIAIDFSSL